MESRHTLLDQLAARFEDTAQSHETLRGWGQYLDPPREHLQVGFYGTAAGVIVLGLAQRGDSPLANEAVNLLISWWGERANERYAQEKIAQTIRLAFLHLALRLSPVADSDAAASEVADELNRRILNHRMWGDFWISDTRHDETPRLLPSALAVLSFSFASQQNADSQIHDAATAIEERLCGPQHIPILDLLAATAAVLSVKGDSVNPKALRKLRGIARRFPYSVSNGRMYIFHFEHSPDESGHPNYDRDYFIAPARLLLALVGLQQGAPTTTRMVADQILNELSVELAEHRVYQEADERRASTVNQSFLALALSQSSRVHRAPSIWERFRYCMIRQRRDNWFTRRCLPISSMFIVAALAILAASCDVLIGAASPFIEGLGSTCDNSTSFKAIGSLAGPLCTLAIGGIYGLEFIGRLVGRR